MQVGTNRAVPSFWEGGARLHKLALSTPATALCQSAIQPPLTPLGEVWGCKKKPVCLRSPSLSVSTNRLWIMDLICHLISLDLNFTSKKNKLGKKIFEFPWRSKAPLF